MGTFLPYSLSSLLPPSPNSPSSSLDCFPIPWSFLSAFLPFPSFPLFSSSLLSPLTSLPLTVHPYPPHPLWAPSSLLITFLPNSPSLPLLSTPSLFSLLRVSTSLELKTSLWPTFPTLPTLAWHAASRLLPFKPCESVLVHYPLNTNA